MKFTRNLYISYMLYVHVHVCVHVQLCPHVCAGERSKSGFSSTTFHLLLLDNLIDSIVHWFGKNGWTVNAGNLPVSVHSGTDPSVHHLCGLGINSKNLYTLTHLAQQALYIPKHHFNPEKDYFFFHFSILNSFIANIFDVFMTSRTTFITIL